jgi:subtilisin family serine protease
MVAARLATLVLVACLAVPAAAQAADTVDLIVRRDSGLSAAERADVRADAGVTHDHNLRLADTEVVSVPADRAADALRELRADPDVRWAQRDAGVSAQADAGADPYWGELWGLQNTGQTILGQLGLADADVDGPEAWQLSTGAGVEVAVVDTGVDATHPDLAFQLATNPGETPGNGVDDDGDGLIDDVSGWDFAYDDNNPSDLKGHGTHVTGTIAARNSNNVGVSGLAPDAKVLMLKGLGDDGQGAWSDLADAFDFAGDRGIRVVNASLGGTGTVPVIDAVVSQHPNTLYVVAAGNNNSDLDISTYYPCEAPYPNVLCVGASDNNDQKASFSNYSSTSVDVFAPGVKIISTYPTGLDCGSTGYCYLNGTSMATPHVAAIAALLLARDPTLTAEEVKQAIMQSAERKFQLEIYGHDGGRANARLALDFLDLPPDADADGIADSADNCPNSANPGQGDADGDGTGDICDGTPRGPDGDGDGIGDLDDRCPASAGPGSSGGCPADPPPPVVTPHDSDGGDNALAQPPTLSALQVTAAGPRCGTRACSRTLRVHAAIANATAATVTIAKRRCARGRCSWQTVLRRSVPVHGGALAATLRVRLAAGKYRATVAVSGAGGTAQRVAALTLR